MRFDVWSRVLMKHGLHGMMHEWEDIYSFLGIRIVLELLRFPVFDIIQPLVVSASML